MGIILRRLWATLRLTRADSSVLGFLGLLVPIYARTKDITASTGRAIPLLFIYMCTFIANDLDDLERDHINHPKRPLPSGHLNLAVAAVLYFSCLAGALFSTRHFVDERIAFWYYGLITIAISYGYVVECLPAIKAPYVAAAISIPLWIVAASYPAEKQLPNVATAGFLIVLGRELCMDIADRSGDVPSALHTISPARLAIFAFSAQVLGLGLLAATGGRAGDLVAVFVLALLIISSLISWFYFGSYRTAIRLMKAEFLVGLYFLA